MRSSRTRLLSLARRLVIWLALLLALILLANRLVTATVDQPFGFIGSNDFVEYWAAGRLLLAGENPYDPEALLAVERAVGWPKTKPLMMWNPPWTLLLVAPFALLPFKVGVLAWLLTNIVLLMACSVILWREVSFQIRLQDACRRAVPFPEQTSTSPEHPAPAPILGREQCRELAQERTFEHDTEQLLTECGRGANEDKVPCTGAGAINSLISIGWHRMGWLMGMVFVPALVTLRMGQISLWLLASVTGFLWLARKQRYGLAGALLALATIKLHVLYLFILAVGFWGLRYRRWGVFLGSGVTLLIAWLGLGIIWPNWLGTYLAVAQTPPTHWATPTPGAILRIILGVDKVWLQYVPSVVGSVVFVAMTRRQGLDAAPGNWAGPILLGSVISASFGWSWDQAVLLLPYLQIIAWLLFVQHSPLSRWLSGAFLLGTLLGMVTLNLLHINELWYF